MKKMLFAAALTTTIVGLTGCGTLEPLDPPVTVASTTTNIDMGPSKVKDQAQLTGSRIPNNRSSSVSSTNAADAQQQMRDNVTPFTFKQ